MENENDEILSELSEKLAKKLPELLIQYAKDNVWPICQSILESAKIIDGKNKNERCAKGIRKRLGAAKKSEDLLSEQYDCINALVEKTLEGKEPKKGKEIDIFEHLIANRRAITWLKWYFVDFASVFFDREKSFEHLKNADISSYLRNAKDPTAKGNAIVLLTETLKRSDAEI
jgi:hypothetical protein